MQERFLANFIRSQNNRIYALRYIIKNTKNIRIVDIQWIEMNIIRNHLADVKLMNDVNTIRLKWESLAFSISPVCLQNFSSGCSLFTSVNECICPALMRLRRLSAYTTCVWVVLTFDTVCWFRTLIYTSNVIE